LGGNGCEAGKKKDEDGGELAVAVAGVGEVSSILTRPVGTITGENERSGDASSSSSSDGSSRFTSLALGLGVLAFLAVCPPSLASSTHSLMTGAGCRLRPC
jgi:hypothetical protein